jgi:hypothetical protein
MRLVLPTQDSWLTRELDALRSQIVVEGTFDAPELALIVHHPRSPVASFRAFMEGVATESLARDETVIVDDEGELANELGWRMRVIEAHVIRPDRSDPVERRLAACYRFLGRDAAVMAVGRRSERFGERRGGLLALFAKGRPDWNGPELAALADLYR